MPRTLFADPAAAVNSVVARVRKDLRSLILAVEQGELDPAVVEQRVVGLSMGWGRDALSLAHSEQCRQATLADIDARGLTPEEVSLRSDADYWWKVTTTLGEVPVFSFAYRLPNAAGKSVTVTPARDEVFPLHRRVRSSRRCLEWSCKVASLHPYRTAQAMLDFFTHGQVKLEDTTIARHATTVGSMIDRRWLYKDVADITEILRTRATRDGATGRPLLYFSSDAHLLRRFEDETWRAAWKNVNGVRMWCQDKDTGGIIHLGGEFTWGDCEEVVRIVGDLNRLGVLPSDGVFMDGTEAQLVVVTDGAKWLVGRLKPLLPGAVWVLDAWHAMEMLAEYAAALFGKGSGPARHLYATLVELLTGRRPKRQRRRHEPRTGQRKRKRRGSCHDHRRAFEEGYGIKPLLRFIRDYLVDPEHDAVHAKFIERLEGDQWRMDYPAFRARGLQIGSGAMESIHRNGSQLRLKLPGARWLVETAQAVMHLRMLEIAGRWDDFWAQDQLVEVMVEAFTPREKAALAAA